MAMDVYAFIENNTFLAFFVDKSRLLLTRPPLLFITQPKIYIL